MLTLLRLPLLAIGALLFGAGIILLAMLLFGDHPYRSGRLVEAEADVVGLRHYCVVTTRHRPLRGRCEALERRAADKPEAFAEATWTRSPLFTILYSDREGRSHTREVSGRDLGLATTTQVGDRVRIKYDRQSPYYVTSATAGGWRHTLQVLAIVGGLLLSATMCWIVGGGRRLVAHQQQRRQRAAARQWQLLVTLAGAVLLAVGWLGGVVERMRKAAAKRPVTRPSQ